MALQDDWRSFETVVLTALPQCVEKGDDKLMVANGLKVEQMMVKRLYCLLKLLHFNLTCSFA